MSKVIFVDDEVEILKHYENSIKKDQSSSSELAKVASEMFNFDMNFNVNLDSDLNSIKTLSAHQGLDAVNLVYENLKTEEPIQVAFIDMRMPPGIDGKETAKRISEMDPRVEIVIVTAYSDQKPDQLLKEIGRPDKVLFLKKPFDISEIKQLIRNLTAKYKSERIKEEFISNVTHELKTPLSSVLGFLELAIEEVPDRGTLMNEYLEIARSNSQLMKTLISDLIDTLSVSHAQLPIIKEKVDLTRLLDESFKSIKAANREGSIKLDCLIPDHPIYVDLDPNRIRQVLYNILGNAIKFTDEGSVTLIAEESSSNVKLSIKDTGPGISSENLKHIFDKFFRVENDHHNKPGLGLGLYLVKTILDSHKIQFQILSELNEGTTFEFVINKEMKA